MKHPASADAIESAISRVLHSVEQGFTLAPTFHLHLDLPPTQTIFYLIRSAIVIENEYTTWERWTQGDSELIAALDCILENTLQKFLEDLQAPNARSKSNQYEWYWIQLQIINFTKSASIDKRHFQKIVHIICQLGFPWDSNNLEYITNWLDKNTSQIHIFPIDNMTAVIDNSLLYKHEKTDIYLSNLIFSDRLLSTTEEETTDLILNFCFENIQHIPLIIELLLLHPRQFIRQQSLLVLEQYFSEYISQTRNRLVQIRNWLPKADRITLDNFLYYYSMQHLASNSLPTNALYTMKHCITVTTDFNNQGYQRIMSLVKADNHYIIFNALLSQDIGWSEVWRGQRMTLSQANEVISQFCQDYEVFEVDSTYMNAMIPIGIGWMQKKGNIPSHILSIWCDALEISNKHPQFYQEMVWLEHALESDSQIEKIQENWLNQTHQIPNLFARYLFNQKIIQFKKIKEFIGKNHFSIAHTICLSARWAQFVKTPKISWQEYVALADLFLNCIEKTRIEFLYQWIESIFKTK